MSASYTNPVYPHECADPFVLAYNGGFWCYRSGPWADGRIFGILHSTDLVHWQPVGGALDPLPGGYSQYWAPEVSYDQGVFYLYYAVGDGSAMHLRVATSRQPQGPFIDSGKRLTEAPFAIDAHVFVDEDGSRYLFYATDFLDVERIGTGTVMDRLLDPFTLAGRPTPVARAKFDWQIFDPQRVEKGGVRWHTVEGSFVLKRKGQYYHMFSGGNYQNISYGVGYATTRALTSGQEWDQVIDGVQRFPVLHTVPGQVMGPGHNSVVIGPDGRQLFCVYHVIRPGGPLERVLAVDRLEFVGERLVVLGPSSTPQPAPIRALPLGFEGQGERTIHLACASFLLSAWVKGAGWSVALRDKHNHSLFAVQRAPAGLLIQAGEQSITLPLPEHYAAEPQVLHPLRLEVNGKTIRLNLEQGITWSGRLAGEAAQLFLSSAEAMDTAGLTYGFMDDFTGAGLSAAGWKMKGRASWQPSSGQLKASGGPVQLVTPIRLENYEWVLNLRVVTGALTLRPALGRSGGPAVRLVQLNGRFELSVDGQPVALPAGFDPAEVQQLRGRVGDGVWTLCWLEHELGCWPAPKGACALALELDEAASVELDLVRVTQIV